MLGAQRAAGALGQRLGLLDGAEEQQDPRQDVGDDGARDGVGLRGQGGAEVVDAARRARRALGQAELEQHARAALLRRRLVERALKQCDRVVGRAAPGGVAAGLLEHLGDPRLAGPRGLEQLGRDRVAARAGVVEHPRGARVAQLALAGRQLLVDRAAHQGMDEAQRRLGREDLGPGEGRQALADRRPVEPGQRGHRRQVGAVAEHGDGGGDLGRRGRQPGQAHEHGARDGVRADVADHVEMARVGRHAVGVQRGEQLAQQQRVAAGGAVAGGAEQVVRLLAQAGPDQRRDRRGAQRARADDRRARTAGDLPEQGGVGARIGRALRGGDEDRLALQAAGEVGQPAQRRPIGPLNVVDEQHQRPVDREVERQPEQAVQRGERALGLGGGIRAGRRLEHGPGGGRGSGQRRLALLGPPQRELEELSHDAEGELALELGAAGGQHERPAGGDVATHLGQQPGLADPRRAVDQQHAAVAAERGVGRALELGDLAVPFDQVVGLGHGRDIR